MFPWKQEVLDRFPLADPEYHLSLPLRLRKLSTYLRWLNGAGHIVLILCVFMWRLAAPLERGYRTVMGPLGHPGRMKAAAREGAYA